MATRHLLRSLMTICFCLGAWHEGSAGDVDRIRQVIANIRANEDLYKDIEIVYRWTYRSARPKAEMPPFLARSGERTHRSVMQGKRFFTEIVESSKNVENKSSESRSFEAYNGVKTRRFAGGGGNVHSGRVEPVDLCRPHILLFSANSVWVPLSTLLEGGPELRSHPHAGIYKDADIKTSVQSRDVIDGLDAILLRWEYWTDEGGPKKELTCYADIWLAVDHNYLPFKTTGYLPKDAKDPAVPVEQAIAQDFREIRPGVWLPFAYRVSTFDRFKSSMEEPVLQNEEHIIVENVVNDPQYPEELFDGPPYPVGTVVREIANGSITRTYVEGRDTEVAPPTTGGWSSFWTVLTANVFLAVIIVAALIARRRRQKSQGAV